MKNELQIIKKKYGEEFMHLCRTLFPTFLEHEGQLLKILESNFEPNTKTLATDLKNEGILAEFKNLIYSKMDYEEILLIDTGKNPFELMKEAGYTLYECMTEEDIQQFKKYYEKDEELCTFNGGRLNNSVVFFAIKDNVNEIKRNKFILPNRDDEYSTSVLSIQFSKKGICTVEIISRYNHKVDFPNSVYSNNLEKIIPGLTTSFKKYLSLKNLDLDNLMLSNNLRLRTYKKDSSGKLYKCNMESNGIYFCPKNIVIYAGKTTKLEPEKRVILDDVVLDIENKKLTQVIPSPNSFINSIKNLGKIRSIDISKIQDGKQFKLFIDDYEEPVIIEIDVENNIIGYENNLIEEIGNSFLLQNNKLKRLRLDNVKLIKNNFLYWNKELEELNLPNLEEIYSSFLENNNKLKKLELPKVKYISKNFLLNNDSLEQINIQNVEEIDNCFLYNNTKLKELYTPKLRRKGHFILCMNENINNTETFFEEKTL